MNDSRSELHSAKRCSLIVASLLAFIVRSSVVAPYHRVIIRIIHFISSHPSLAPHLIPHDPTPARRPAHQTVDDPTTPPTILPIVIPQQRPLKRAGIAAMPAILRREEKSTMREDRTCRLLWFVACCCYREWRRDHESVSWGE